MSTETILVPVDGTPPSAAAIPLALRLSSLLRAGLHLIHVTEAVPPSPDELLRRLGVEPGTLAGAIIDSVPGAPAEAILRTAQERRSGLICLSTHGSTEHLGPVAGAVLRQLTCPLLLVRPGQLGSDWNPARILLTHDGSPETFRGERIALQLAEAAQAELLIATVVSEPTSDAGAPSGTMRTPRYLDQPQHEWAAWAQENLERLTGLTGIHTPSRPRLFIRRGDPADQILQLAREKEAALIVLSSHGEVSRVIEPVVLQSPCPVLILRAPGPAK